MNRYNKGVVDGLELLDGFITNQMNLSKNTIKDGKLWIDINVIDRLRKEKEWLIKENVEMRINYMGYTDRGHAKDKIIKRMQQALKESE